MTTAGKAERLLLDGRVTVRAADLDGRLTADVEGDHGLWSVHRTAGGSWTCSCPAAWFTRACSHMAAVRLITGDQRP